MSLLKPESKIQIEYPEEKNFAEYALRKSSEFAAKGRQESFYNLETDKITKFSEYNDLITHVAKSFNKRGLRKGDVVIYASQDVGHLYFIIIGIWRANGVVRSIYPTESVDHVKKAMEDCGCKWLICDPGMARNMKKAFGVKDISHEILVVGDKVEGCSSVQDLFKETQGAGAEIPSIKVGLDDISLIIPTSGTTGPCKEVVLTHKNLIFGCEILDTIPFSTDMTKPILWFGKIAHASGLLYPLYTMVNGQYIMRGPFSPQLLFSSIEKHKIKTIFMPTPMLVPLLEYQAKKYDLKSLKHINCGGVLINRKFIDNLKQNYPSIQTISNFYGQTECSIIIGPVVPNLEQKRSFYESPSKSIGKLLPGVNVQVRDKENGQNVFWDHQHGEIYIKSDTNFKEYYNDPEATNEAIQPGNWFKSGDFGYFDERGFIYILDRIKDLFTTTIGTPICPAILENVLMDHPAIFECLVLPEPYAPVGDPRAFVILNEGYEPSEELIQDIQKFSKSKLAEEHYLTGGIFIITDLPKSQSGKNSRRLLANYQPSESDVLN